MKDNTAKLANRLLMHTSDTVRQRRRSLVNFHDISWPSAYNFIKVAICCSFSHGQGAYARARLAAARQPSEGLLACLLKRFLLAQVISGLSTQNTPEWWGLLEGISCNLLSVGNLISPRITKIAMHVCRPGCARYSDT